MISLQASLTNFLLIEPKVLVVYLLFLLVGLLLTYRHKNKLKDRTQDCKDEEKNKKENKGKSKKLFTKFKEKETITGVRNKNEPIVDDFDEKMGLSHSTKKRNAKVQGRATASAPTSTNNLRNGSTSYLQKHQKPPLSTGALTFVSDEIKTNTIDRNRQSSLKFLHESIEIIGKPKQEEVLNNNNNNDVNICRDIEHLKSKIDSDDSSYLNGSKTHSRSPSHSSTNECDNDKGITFKTDNIAKVSTANQSNSNITVDIETLKFSNNNDIKASIIDKDCHTQNGVPLIRRPDITYSGKKPVDISSITGDFRIEKDIENTPNLIEKNEIVFVTPTSKVNRTKSSDVKQNSERSPKIISKPKAPSFISKIKHEELDKQDVDNEAEVSVNGFSGKYEANHHSSAEPSISDNFLPNEEKPGHDSSAEQSISDNFLHNEEKPSHDSSAEPIISDNFLPNKEKTTIELESRVIEKSVTSSSTSSNNTFVYNYADILIKSIVNNMYLELKDNFRQVLLNINNKSILDKNDVHDVLPALEDTENIVNDKIIEDVPVDNLIDISLLANSVSYNILKNVLKEFDLLTEKTTLTSTETLKRSSTEIDVVDQNKIDVVNEIQHESTDVCDGAPITLRSSQSCEVVKTSPHVTHDVKIMGNTNSTGKGKENIQKVIESSVNYFAESPKLSLNDNETEEQQPPVVLRRKSKCRIEGSRNHLSTPILVDDNKIRYSFTDRPLSGFAEQLAELLADDLDLDLVDFDSDSEFQDALEKIKEITDKPNISNEIGKIQRKCSLIELNEYGVKKFKSKVQSKLDDKKGEKKLKGDRPLSLYEQDLLDDLMTNEEFDEYDEVDEEGVESVQSSVQLLEDKIPFINRDVRVNSTDSLDDIVDESTRSNGLDTKSASTGKAHSIGKAAVIDLGSGILKAGMCGDMKPSCYCPSVIGVPRRLSQDVSKMKKGYYVGDEAWTMAGMLSIDYPVKQDITNWSDVTSIIEHLLDIELQVVDNHPVLLTEMSLVCSKQREKLTEVMFETFNVPAFYLADQSSLALYSMGMTTGICLNSGFSCTQSVPVYEGSALPYATHQLDIGGDHVSNQLGRILLGTQGQVFNTSSEKLVLNTMKQSHCYVAQDPTAENELYKTTADMLRTYTLPDGQEIQLSTERFLAPEILFDPGILGLNKPNTAEIVLQTVERVERTLSPVLKDNILVCGGTTKFSGFGPRLETELQQLSRHGESYNVKYVENPLLATWIGGSVLSSISSFRDQWITIDTYAESGSKIVHKVCF